MKGLRARGTRLWIGDGDHRLRWLGLAHLGSPYTPDTPAKNVLGLPAWADARGVDAVIWAGLKFKFDGKDEPPTGKQVVEYLRGLTGSKRDKAERYVRMAPLQTDTEIRRRIEKELGWVPLA